MANNVYYKSGYNQFLHRSLYAPTTVYDSVSIDEILGEGAITVGAGGGAVLGEESVFEGSLQDAIITTAAIKDLSVDTAKLANLAVEASKLANSSVESTKIANLAVGSAAIAALAVGTGHIANLAVISAKVNDLEATKITGQVVNAQIANIAYAKITNVAVTNAQISGTITVGHTEAKCTNASADQTSVNTAANSNQVQGYTVISGGKVVTGLLTADNIQTGTLTGRTIQTRASGTRVVMTNNEYIYFYNGAEVKGYIYCTAAKDLILKGVDDVVFDAGNGIRCGVHSSSFKPLAGGYDLGEDTVNTRWDYVYGNVYSARGHGGESAAGETNYGFVSTINDEVSGGYVTNVQYKKRDITICGGIVTNVGAEGGWINA